jgi:pyruvate carboxylase
MDRNSHRITVLGAHLRAASTAPAAAAAAAAAAGSAASALKKTLIANRGEIAVRIARGAREIGLPTVAVYSAEDAQSLHSRVADEALAIATADGAGGIAAYLDIDAIIAAAKQSGADSIAPGYGFLSENAEFAERCEAEGIVFIGPTAEVITMFGDKLSAKAFALECGVPVINGSDEALPSGEAMSDYVASTALRFPLMLKAANGGGGRGMRVVEEQGGLLDAFERCSSEAAVAFGSGAVFVEEYLPTVRHIEIQVLGDGTGDAIHLYERDCSVQRRNQKMIEIAPSRGMHAALRQRMTDAALALAKASSYRGAGTVEFLLEGDLADPDARFFFLEVNPRLQVEHTVTEQVTGIDLVHAILQIAAGSTLASLGLSQDSVRLQGYAIQSRITIEPSADFLITAYSEPTGPGVRVDAAAYAGLEVRTEFDPLIAKVITFSPSSSFDITLKKMEAALSDYYIEGIETNISSVLVMLAHKDFASNAVFTRFIADNEEDFFGSSPPLRDASVGSGTRALFQQGKDNILKSSGGSGAAAINTGFQVSTDDPLAVLELKANAPEL